jgi:site-specific recombinase XerD
MARTFHPSAQPDYFLHLIESGKTDRRLTDHDAEILTEFIKTRKTKTGERVSAIRRTKLAQTLISVKQFLKCQWTDAKIKDLSDAVDALNESRYKQNTKNDHIVILKTFYRWMIRKKQTKITLEQLSDEDDGIRAPGVNTETAEAKDLLTRDELAIIVQGCKNLRDKAIVTTLYESAARISELSRLKWGDLEYTNEGIIKATIHDEKTKKKRYSPLFLSMEYLAAWRAGYPGKPSDDAYIFIDRDNKPMEYRAINYQITRAAKRAGIEKRVTPHLFRKSRLTEMVREGYQESVIKEVGWANQGSQMMKTYIKLGSDDVMNEFLVRQGIKKKEQKVKENVPRQCSYCFAMNSPVSEYCHKCGQPLTEEAKKERTKVMAVVEAEEFSPEDIQKAMAVLKAMNRAKA